MVCLCTRIACNLQMDRHGHAILKVCLEFLITKYTWIRVFIANSETAPAFIYAYVIAIEWLAMTNVDHEHFFFEGYKSTGITFPQEHCHQNSFDIYSNNLIKIDFSWVMHNNWAQNGLGIIIRSHVNTGRDKSMPPLLFLKTSFKFPLHFSSIAIHVFFFKSEWRGENSNTPNNTTDKSTLMNKRCLQNFNHHYNA